MVIKNFDQLAKTALRKKALQIAEAGYESIRVDKLIPSNIKLDGDALNISSSEYDLKQYDKIYIAGIGKGSALATYELEKILGDRIVDGHVIDIQKGKHKIIKSHIGTHPLPSEANQKATEEMIAMLRKATEKDLVLTIICGGGSSLACKPGGLSCLEMQFITKILLMAGATIQEINILRKHVSMIHGGHIAEFVYPAKLVSLIFSDVPGDDPSVISSGPTVLDKSTRQQAVDIAKKYKLPDFKCLETPKDPKYFKNVDNILLASGKTVVEAMRAKAEELGFKPRIIDTELQGHANEVGPMLAKEAKAGEAILAAGETEVIVSHPGKGGRNQDVVLSSISNLTPESVILSLASDGKDNVEVAGAIADSNYTKEELAKINEDPMSYVNMNNSFVLLDKLKDHVFINPVTVNVSDFMLVLKTDAT